MYPLPRLVVHQYGIFGSEFWSVCYHVGVLQFVVLFEAVPFHRAHHPDVCRGERYTNVIFIYMSLAYKIHYLRSTGTEDIDIVVSKCLYLTRYTLCDQQVLKTVLSVIVVFTAFIAGFAFAFYFLNELGADDEFSSIQSSLMKVVRMTIGDGTVSKKAKSRSGSGAGDLTDYMYLLFALLLPIVMVNLMVSVTKEI